MTWLIVFGIVALFGLLFFYWISGVEEPVEEFNPLYKEDIDWSLMAKGYPVVNDIDIEYTEWLAKSAT